MTFKESANALVAKMTLSEKISQMRYDSPAIERLGIPAYNWWNECLHGVARQGAATVFPQAIGLAATFDDEHMFKVATAISDEARAKYNAFQKYGTQDGTSNIYQGLTFWSPNINIFRDPRWGRGQETYGEDPYLTGRMGTAFIKGLQGNGKYRKLDATIKHYAVHSGPEKSRHSFDAVVNDRDLYETYLSAFKYCIDHADPSAVMGAYNRVNGEACCASQRLLKDILYGEFGFKGYVVSDCGAIQDISDGHRLTDCPVDSAAMAVNNGCDLNCGYVYRRLREAVDKGILTEETITHSVEKLFEARFRLGMFANDCEYDQIPIDVVECEEFTALNRRTAQKSMVLLKNDGILPLPEKGLRIAVIGPNADRKSVLLGNYNGTPSRYTTLLAGLQNGSENKVDYAEGCHLYRSPIGWSEYPLNEAKCVANRADVVILCMGISPEMEGEEFGGGADGMSGDKITLDLPPCQMELIHEIVALGKKTIFVNVSGSCINLSFADEACNAVLQCFYPGAEGGNALADMIFGRVSPSGRLPVSFYKSVDDLPPFEDYSMENRTYKFYKGKCVYDFGYGLTYSDIREEWISDNEVVVSNHGPFDTDYSVLKFNYIPHKNLCGFKNIHIKQGETVTVNFA